MTPSAAASASPSSAATGSASTAIVSDPRCDAYLTAADVASVVGPVASLSAAELPAITSGSPKDLTCTFSLTSGASIKFQVIHERVGSTTLGGSKPAVPGAVAKPLAIGGAPVPGLGLAAASVVSSGVPVLGWEVSVTGFDTISETLEGGTPEQLLAIAKLVR